MPEVFVADRFGLAGFALADGAESGDTIAMHQNGSQRRYLMV